MCHAVVTVRRLSIVAGPRRLLVRDGRNTDTMLGNCVGVPSVADGEGGGFVAVDGQADCMTQRGTPSVLVVGGAAADGHDTAGDTRCFSCHMCGCRWAQ